MTPRPDVPQSLVSPDPQRKGHSEGGRLGVVGTLVWDRIHSRDLRRKPVEEWGGISYAMEALSVVLPDGWVMKPILKVGEDLARDALEYLATIPRVELGDGIQVVPFDNYQVELRYQDQNHRLERMTGSVPPWRWDELERHLEGVDALYLNFITGMEMKAETAAHLPGRFSGPLYADLHSLFQGITPEGQRYPRELPSLGTWLRAFDAVQMNEVEFELMGRSWNDPWEMAAENVGSELELIAVTMGGGGAAYVASSGFTADPRLWPGQRRRSTATGNCEPLEGRFPLSQDPASGDPTGCGDVWGATFFARLLGGWTLEAAMAEANRLAAKNVHHRGARGLRHHLRDDDVL